MGTSFTRQQFERLIAMTDHVVFSFDGDGAGRTAAWRALHTVLPLLEDRLTVRFLVIPDGDDPDELIQKSGPAAYQRLLDAAPQLSEFLIATLKEKHHGLATAEDRARFASEGSGIASQLPREGKLRRILQQQIAAEASIGVASMRAITSVSVRTTRAARAASLWDRLLTAVRCAPDIAFEHRETLLELIDPEADDEAELHAAIWGLRAPGAEAEDGGSSQPEPDAEWMMARDLLAGAIDAIIAKRREQSIAELKRQYDGGALSEAEYARQSMRIGAGT
jgi:DNA primase